MEKPQSQPKTNKKQHVDLSPVDEEVGEDLP